MAENKDDKNNKGRKKLEIKELETDVLIIGGAGVLRLGLMQ